MEKEINEKRQMDFADSQKEMNAVCDDAINRKSEAISLIEKHNIKSRKDRNRLMDDGILDGSDQSLMLAIVKIIKGRM